MVGAWEIVEKLPAFGGEAVYYQNVYMLKKYYPGPDRRYNGEIFKLEGSRVREYRVSLIKSWDRYIELREKLRDETDITTNGFEYSNIYLRHYGKSGITEYGHNGLISTRERLDKICAELKSMPVRHLQIIGHMKSKT